MRWVYYFVVSVLCTPLVVAGQPCNQAAENGWVRNTYEHVTAFDTLAKYAIHLNGSPVSCDGSVTATFDGTDFGQLVLSFAGGLTFEIKTLPPESSIATLRSVTGFRDEALIRRLLMTYADQIGLEIEWTSADVLVDGQQRVETYWDPDDGMNASARLTFLNDRLVSVRVSLAL